MFCKICGNINILLGEAKVLEKYDVKYYSCESCGFIQTESPYWLEEAYVSAIARSDIGLIGRNIKLSSSCASLIPFFFDSKLPFLDYGGGNGMFVRMMRDRGFEFYWHDIYSSNQFAKGFEAFCGEKYSLVTAFEVFEHLLNPLEIIEDMFRYSDTIIFSTRLLPYWKIKPEDWWYFTLDTGQHVSLYSRESLELIARKFKVQFSSNGISLHVLSPRKIPALFLKGLSYSPFASVVSVILNIGRKSLLDNDYYKITGKRLIR